MQTCEEHVGTISKDLFDQHVFVGTSAHIRFTWNRSIYLKNEIVLHSNFGFCNLKITSVTMCIKTNISNTKEIV